MTTTPVSSAAPNTVRSRSKELQTDDFIKMMITQLQNQDPLEPAKNQELLAQMSQISQMQSASSLQETIKEMAVQNKEVVANLAAQSQISSAGQLIGKLVEGKDATGKDVSGIVTSVSVKQGVVELELDNAKTLPMGAVTRISPGQGTVQASMEGA